MQKRHSNLVDAIQSISAGGETAKHLEETLENKGLVHKLFGLRCSKGVTQAEMATRLNCSQSRISKLENGEDDDVTLGDLRRYLSALGAEVNITVFARKPTIVEKVKHHVWAIKRQLDKLAGLANYDEKLASPIAMFFGECFFNIVKQLQQSARALPATENGDPFFGIHVDIVDDEDGESSAPAASSDECEPEDAKCAAAS